MIKVKKIFDRITIFELLFGIVIILSIYIFKQRIIKAQSDDIIYTFINIFGNFNINSIDFIEYGMYLSLYIMPMYLFGKYISEDFNKNSIYLFTRTNNISRWLNNKIIYMFILINLYFFIQFMFIFIISQIQGFIIYEAKQAIIIIFSIYINVVIQTMILTLLINIMSTKFNELISYLFVIIFFSFSILLSIIFKLFKIVNYLKYVPFISSLTGWYSSLNYIIDRNLYYNEFYINGYNFTFNFIINLLILFLLIRIIKKYYKNKEII